MSIPPVRHTLLRLAARFLSGRCMDGIRRTNATFTQPATRDLTVHERAPAWTWLPGYRRLLMRLMAVGVLSGSVYGYLYDRALTVSAVVTAMVTTIAWESVKAYRNIRMWNHRRKVIYPLWHILAGIVGYPLGEARYLSVPRVWAGLPHYSKRERPDKFLTVPTDYETNDNAIVRFELPYTWEANPKEQVRVSQLINRHLGGDWAATWQHKQTPKYVALCHEPKPPASLTLTQFAPHIDASDDNALALGIGASGQIIAYNLDSEVPHTAISCGTGGGKSDTVALMIAQLVRKGCERIDIIDPKRVSHAWAKGLAGVHIYRYVDGQAEAISQARIRMDGRYQALESDADAVFSRQVLIIEEQNSLMTDLSERWQEIRSEASPADRATMPKIHPAVKDLRYILNKGRQCRINVISVYQRMSAQAAGGGDARSQYGAKLLARFDHSTWRMLVGTTPIPRSSLVPGRALLVIGDSCREVQRAYASISKPDGSADREGIARLRAFALNGRPDVTQPGSPVTAQAAGPETEELVTLHEACADGIVPMKYGALQKARKRDCEFPAAVPRGCALAYRPADLRAWHANRPRAGRSRAPAAS